MEWRGWGKGGLRSERSAVRSLIIICGLLFFTTTFCYWLINHFVPTAFFPSGDEPHYLVISQTLAKYHSLDVMRDYLRGDYRDFYPIYLDPHVTENKFGQELPLHSIGGPILWLIPFLLLGRLGAMLFMSVVSVLIVVNIYQFLRTMEFSEKTAFRVSLIYALASPIYIYSRLNFVEPLAALACIYLARLFFQKELKPVSIVLASCVLGVLPWIHIRFAWFEIIFFFVLLYKIYMLYGWRGWKSALAFILPVSLLFLLFEIYNYVIWGSLNPAANQIHAGSAPFEVAPWGGLLGLLFDQEHGILIVFPFCVLLVAGIIFTCQKRFLAYNLLTILLSVPYIILFTSFRHWSGGWCPPARFMLVLLPLYAFYLARAYDLMHSRLAKLVYKASLAWGLFYALLTLLPPAHGFEAESGKNTILSFLHTGSFSITDYLPTVYNASRWPVLLIWILLYLAITFFCLLSGSPGWRKYVFYRRS